MVRDQSCRCHTSRRFRAATGGVKVNFQPGTQSHSASTSAGTSACHTVRHRSTSATAFLPDLSPSTQERPQHNAYAAFSELGEFFDLPVRSYSSGMLLRLAFAIATHGSPEILLMDEWILAGDESFRAKATARLEALVNSAEILVLASHDRALIAKWCNRVFELRDGGLVRL